MIINIKPIDTTQYKREQKRKIQCLVTKERHDKFVKVAKQCNITQTALLNYIIDNLSVSSEDVKEDT